MNNTVYPEEKLNKENSAELKGKILDFIKKNKITFISFKNVIYLDKEGLNTLIELLEYSKKQNRELWLCEVKSEIMEFLTFTNLNNLFKIYNNPCNSSE
ncbi:MAG: STAS domain-containing protein [Flexistipes sinusarabici]|uniref:STAS domain-containing protein n=1 Tax=Flexistipes sinusarabici TaxID=2352 RepID=A0A5D0MIP1_FLESI|nr:STAS domain-containing protein [Flexistipes sinusarabici]TYB32252.1 MAG: STAS domain-containing protein [Flexistipes sinusarabici]